MKTTMIILSLLGVLYFALSFFIRNGNGTKMLRFGIPVGIISAIVGVIFSLIVQIDGQSVGVVVTPTGIVNEPLQTGWRIVMPWNQVFKMDKTVWVYTFSQNVKEGNKPDADAIWAPTKDGIKMGFDVSVSWKIEPENAPWIYSNISEADGGPNGRYAWIEENIIRAKTKSIVALTVSEFTPAEAYSQGREKIQTQAFLTLKKELKQYHLILDQVNIREVFYNKEYEQAINNKKLAEQEALRLVDVTKQKEELLKQAGIDKDITIQEAEGEARALQIKGNSVASNPKIIELQWIEKWDGALPTYMMGNGQGIMLNLK